MHFFFQTNNEILLILTDNIEYIKDMNETLYRNENNIGQKGMNT